MPVKILGGGDAPKGVTIHAHAFTRSALDKLADGRQHRPAHQLARWAPIDEAAEAKEAAATEADDEAKAEKRVREG